MKYRYNYATMQFKKFHVDPIGVKITKVIILILFVAFITHPLWGN